MKQSNEYNSNELTKNIRIDTEILAIYEKRKDDFNNSSYFQRIFKANSEWLLIISLILITFTFINHWWMWIITGLISLTLMMITATRFDIFNPKRRHYFERERRDILKQLNRIVLSEENGKMSVSLLHDHIDDDKSKASEFVATVPHDAKIVQDLSRYRNDFKDDSYMLGQIKRIEEVVKTLRPMTENTLNNRIAYLYTKKEKDNEYDFDSGYANATENIVTMDDNIANQSSYKSLSKQLQYQEKERDKVRKHIDTIRQDSNDLATNMTMLTVLNQIDEMHEEEQEHQEHQEHQNPYYDNHDTHNDYDSNDYHHHDYDNSSYDSNSYDSGNYDSGSYDSGSSSFDSGGSSDSSSF